MKKLRNTLLILLLMFGCLGFSRNVQAETLLREKTVTIESYGDKTLYSFKIDGESVWYVEVDISLKHSSDKGSGTTKDMTFSVYGGEDDDCILSYEMGQEGTGYAYIGGQYGDLDLEIGGTYYFLIENYSDYDYDVSYKIWKYPCMAETITLPKQIDIKVGNTKIIKPRTVIPYGGYPAIRKWTVQNKSILDIDDWGNVYAKKTGSTYVTATMENGYQSKCKVTVTGRPPQMNYKKFTMVTQYTLKAELLYADGNIKWSSSNPKVATVSRKGIIKAKSIGECTITARYKKVNYTAKVVVKRQFPKYEAKITQYNTRDNYFVVSFANSSNKPLTVYSSGARVEDKDYRSYDRYLYLSNSSITIPAKKTVSVKFYVSGGITWYQYRDFTLIYRMSFDGGNYDAKVSYNINEPGYWKSIFKRGNKWYYTGH